MNLGHEKAKRRDLVRSRYNPIASFVPIERRKRRRRVVKWRPGMPVRSLSDWNVAKQFLNNS
jgi:hypothetical protein